MRSPEANMRQETIYFLVQTMLTPQQAIIWTNADVLLKNTWNKFQLHI